jgi:ComF family protein
MFIFLLKIKKLILDILFPVTCLACGRDGIYLCPECWKKIPVTEEFFCPFCRRPSLRGEPHQACARQTRLDGLLVAGDWENKILRRAIHRFKYNFLQDLKKPLGEILSAKIKQSDRYFSPTISGGYFDFLLPVPLHPKRKFWRGFNQAQLLALELAEFFKIPTVSEAVVRVKKTKTQVGKNQKARRKNMQGAFQVRTDFEEMIKGKRILLVDDVVTTGETMEAMALVLRAAGAAEVWGLCLARG